MVEHSVHTRSVICSSQIAATIWPVGQAVKTPPFHGGNMGSIPVRVTKNRQVSRGTCRFCFMVLLPVRFLYKEKTPYDCSSQSYGVFQLLNTQAHTYLHGRKGPAWQDNRTMCVPFPQKRCSAFPDPGFPGSGIDVTMSQQQQLLSQQLFPNPLLPQQQIRTRMMIHHQLLPPNPQIPLELQFITRPPERNRGHRPVHSMICWRSGLVTVTQTVPLPGQRCIPDPPTWSAAHPEWPHWSGR